MKPFWTGQIKTKSSSGLRSSALTKIPNWKVLWTEFYEHIFMEPYIIFRKEDLLKRPLERRATKVRMLSRVWRWSLHCDIHWLGHGTLHPWTFITFICVSLSFENFYEPGFKWQMILERVELSTTDWTVWIEMSSSY